MPDPAPTVAPAAATPERRDGGPLPPQGRARTRLAVAAVYLGTMMATIAISIVNVALPAIQSALGAELAQIQWVVGSYALCLSAFMLSAGPIGDRFGRKRVWLAGVGLFMAGSAISATASSLPFLIAGGAVQGLAGALVIPGALAILTQAFPDPQARARVIGGWSSFSAVSLVLGPMLGGLLVEHVGWPSIFLINLPVGLAAFLLGSLGIAESADPDLAGLDPAGQALSAVILGSLTYALIGAGPMGWGAGPVLAAFGLCGAGLAAFVLVERRAAHPALPIALFRNGEFALANLASFVLGFTAYSSLFLFSLFLQQIQGWSAAQTGWRLTPVFIAMALAATAFGRVAGRFGLRSMMLAGYLLIGVAMLAMTGFTPTTPYAAVAALFAQLGIGMGLAVPATGAAAMQAAPRERSGVASATMNALRQSGMTIGIALLGTVMAGRAVARLGERLAAAGVADAATAAAEAVQRHRMPAGLPLAPEAFTGLLRGASADGFAAAVAIAGLLALLAAAMLGLDQWRERHLSRPSPPQRPAREEFRA